MSNEFKTDRRTDAMNANNTLGMDYGNKIKIKKKHFLFLGQRTEVPQKNKPKKKLQFLKLFMFLHLRFVYDRLPPTFPHSLQFPHKTQ